MFEDIGTSKFLIKSFINFNKFLNKKAKVTFVVLARFTVSVGKGNQEIFKLVYKRKVYKEMISLQCFMNTTQHRNCNKCFGSFICCFKNLLFMLKKQKWMFFY